MKKLIVIMILLLVMSISTNATVIYQENFEDGSADGITIHRGIWSISTGINSNFGFHGNDDQCMFSLNEIPSDNITVDVDFSISDYSYGDFEVWLNATFDNDLQYIRTGYQLMVNPKESDNEKADIGRLDNSISPTILTETANVISANEIHHLRVERLGSTINMILDDQPFLTTEDSTYTGGIIGFRLFKGGMVDNIVVTPEPATLLLLGIGGLMLRKRRA
jgi:hypothetical protein